MRIKIANSQFSKCIRCWGQKIENVSVVEEPQITKYFV